MLVKAKTDKKPAKKETVVKLVKVTKKTERMLIQAITNREEARRLMQEADKIEQTLFDSFPAGSTAMLSSGHAVKLVDNFAESNVKWCHTPARRFQFAVDNKLSNVDADE